MKLIELLKTIPLDTLIGLWETDDKRSCCPTPQQYQKVGNIPWNKLQNLSDLDVFGVIVNGKNSGLLIKLYDKERLKQSLNNWDLANKING